MGFDGEPCNITDFMRIYIYIYGYTLKKDHENS